MRYYWFRLSDVMIPVAVAFLSAQSIHKLASSCPVKSQWALASCIVLVTANTSDVFLRRMYDARPSAIAQAQPTELSKEQADRCYHDWLNTCEWIATHTRTDELFLTPRNQQTFKWYAQRGEVVAWKDIPQDAVGVVEWNRRINEVFSPSVRGYDLAAHGEEELQRLSAEYGFRYVVVDRSRSKRPLGFLRVYPERWQGDSCFEVYRLPPQSE